MSKSWTQTVPCTHVLKFRVQINQVCSARSANLDSDLHYKACTSPVHLVWKHTIHVHEKWHISRQSRQMATFTGPKRSAKGKCTRCVAYLSHVEGCGEIRQSECVWNISANRPRTGAQYLPPPGDQSNPLIARRCYLRLRRVIGQCPNKSKIATTHILHAEEGMMDIIIIIIIITIIIIIIIIIIIMMMIIIRFREAEEGIIGNFTFKFPPGWLLKPFHRIIPALIMSNIIMMVTMILTSRIMIMMIILMIRNGQFYHLPTFSNVVATGQDGLWMTEFKGGIISWSSW